MNETDSSLDNAKSDIVYKLMDEEHLSTNWCSHCVGVQRSRIAEGDTIR